VNLVLACPSCGNRLEIGEEFFGRKVRCGGCKETVQVPRVEASGPPPPEADGATIRSGRPADDRRDAAPRRRDQPRPLPHWPDVTAPRKGWTPLAIVLAVVIAVLVGCGGGVVAISWVVYIALGTIESSKEDIAKAQIKGVLGPAVMRFKNDQVNNPSGELPDELNDLLAANNAKAGLKYDQLIDPWGRPFQYSLESAHNAPDGFDIWTQTPSGEVIGNWKQ
jgi:hypothetical protein